MRPIIIVLFSLAIAGFPFCAAALENKTNICDTGLFVNKAQLARAKLRLADPKWRDDALTFQTRAKAEIKLQPTPYKGGSSWIFLDSGRKDIMAAMDLALYASITSAQDKVAAANSSKTILLAWAHDTLFDGQFSKEKLENKQDFSGLGLYLGLMGIGGSHAYQLLKCNGTLSFEEDSLIVDWLRRISEVVLEGQRRWEANKYFAQPVGNNHISYQNAALYAISVIIDNAKLRDWVLQGTQNPTSFIHMLNLAIYNGSELVEIKLYGIGAAPNRGEITDRYRMADDKKGLHYAFFHLLALTLTAEVAANQGMNFYHRKAVNGETLADPLLYYGQLLSAVTCSNPLKVVDSKGPKGFEFYSGSPIDPLYWAWIEPLMSRLNDNRAIKDLSDRIHANSCKIAPPEYLPIPFSKLTHAED